jgi:hypothetical protein
MLDTPQQKAHQEQTVYSILEEDTILPLQDTNLLDYNTEKKKSNRAGFIVRSKSTNLPKD